MARGDFGPNRSSSSSSGIMCHPFCERSGCILMSPTAHNRSRCKHIRQNCGWSCCRFCIILFHSKSKSHRKNMLLDNAHIMPQCNIHIKSPHSY
ncbi:hypothetical protein FR483_n051R [Paramecium bursaria Chlorella virus FR483]|uniref:Uncharacterized protein n051R n=1 Tax=Paramecium bursaria Chlorella virus FR483 TaxID=399781 RepID=A7J6A5_PBCVF|nr:hypothetical protein FR483_n051R [Paramecium bursaria Chlorella virus FR483]ABT15336.1 hypothetical protein FR483_n051R [Paramecium bursaria Chlorella virus FR483]